MKIALCVVLTIGAGLFMALPVRAGSISWTQFQGDAQHTGHISVNISPANITPLWTKTSASLGVAGLVPGVATNGTQVFLTASVGSSGQNHNYNVLGLD